MATRRIWRPWKCAPWTATWLWVGRAGTRSWDTHGRETGDHGGPGAICPTQVALGGTERLDQARAWLSPLQPARPEKSPGRVGLGVPDVECSTAPSFADGIREAMHRHSASHRRMTPVYAATTEGPSNSCSVAPVASTLQLPPESPRIPISKIVRTSYGADS